jgi:hypothetical protein
MAARPDINFASRVRLNQFKGNHGAGGTLWSLGPRYGADCGLSADLSVKLSKARVAILRLLRVHLLFGGFHGGIHYIG